MKNQKDQFVTKIIENLDKVKVSDWEGYTIPQMLPRNVFTDNNYQGVNVLSLYIDCLINKYAVPYFGTFKNIKDAGGRLKKKSVGSPIVFFKLIYQHKKSKKRINQKFYSELPDDRKNEYDVIPIVKNHYVFNIANIENIDEIDLNLEFESEDIDVNDNCEIFIKQLEDKGGLKLLREQYNNSAFYNFEEDHISIPKKSFFKNENLFYTTIFHEMIHWTGNESRLKRKLVAYSMDPESYSNEELIAEMGAMLMGLQFGYSDHITNSIRYLKNFLEQTKRDEKVNTLNEAFYESKKAKKYIEKLIK
jgi:antirestriction protein ArdC